MENFKKHIERCFELIERKLDKGPLKEWNTDDFKLLSEAIQEATGTLLSVSTLKRLSGKVSYASKPNSSTLNALVGYVGFKDWRTFLKDTVPNNHAVKTKSDKKSWMKFSVPILGLTLGLALFFFFSQGGKTYDPDDFTFESRPISTGIPNSVVFDYDASAAEADSKIEIQQYWDETKRTTIDKTDSVATSIYYHPGFFKSKLVVDSTIVKENDVFIPTEDWLGIIEQEPKPIYLDRSDILKGDKMAITSEVVAAHHLDSRTSQVVVSFYQVRDFGDLYTDNFEMATTIKNDFKQGLSGSCQGAQVYILYDGGAVGIPLAKKGCISNLTLMTFEEFVDGKKNDLSGFGVDFSDYVRLKCISENGRLDVFLDDKLIYEMKVPQPAVKIKGITIHFEGAGSVKNVIFKRNDGVVYASAF